MSRNLILSLATAAAIAVSLGANSADARGFAGGGFGGGRFGGGHFAGGGRHAGGGRTLTPVLNPGRGPGRPGGPGHIGFPGHPGHPGHWAHFPHRGHFVFRGGRWIDIGGDAVDEATAEVPAAVSAPGPCTCLTKTYTPDGLVVFADVCTKEAASARVEGNASDATQAPPVDQKSDATQAPTTSNYAGRTYQDYLAANAQAQKN